MSTTQFIAKQHVKYYWKVMKGSVRQDTTDDIERVESDSFWEYEQTPRYL